MALYVTTLSLGSVVQPSISLETGVQIVVRSHLPEKAMTPQDVDTIPSCFGESTVY